MLLGKSGENSTKESVGKAQDAVSIIGDRLRSFGSVFDIICILLGSGLDLVCEALAPILPAEGKCCSAGNYECENDCENDALFEDVFHGILSLKFVGVFPLITLTYERHVLLHIKTNNFNNRYILT